MPENSSMKQKHQRPTSDIYLETGRKLLSEMEKSTVADSNKQVSMLLARSRSRSLDILSLPNDKLTKVDENLNCSNTDDILLTSSSSPAEERDFEQLNMYETNSSVTVVASSYHAESSENNARGTVKDESSPSYLATHKMEKSTLLKEKSELNNNRNNGNENYNNTNRSSCSSSISTTSSNYSCASKSNHSKLQRRPTSTLEGAAAFQEVVLKTEPIRITGYLEKRSKVLGWKKFWFVLDGRLLTYYKSKADYESLSACCGCINLGIATTVRPIQIRGCKGYPLQIVTRSQIYYLRSQEKPVLEQWLIAIQEAASSTPSASILTSWNSYSGSQYFRHSFTSQSQWSLNNSTDDISNITDRLGNLPDTFYQKRDNSLALSNTSSQVSPVIHKYHSFASLQTPIINDFGGERKFLMSSTENLRDLQDVNRKAVVSNSNAMMQHSTSLLVLDSSPQAAELRKELTRKLSIGSSKNSYTDAGDEESETVVVPTPKLLLLSAKQKLQLGPNGDNNESHDYAEIGEFMEGNKINKPYENCNVEQTNIASSIAQHQIRGESAEKDSNIYEHIETVDCVPNGTTGAPAAVWEPLNEGNNMISNNKRFPTHRMSAGSNRNSLVSISEVPEDVSSISPSPVKTPMLTSIPEASWRTGIEPYKDYQKNYSEDELSSCRSESFRSLPCVEKSAKKRRGKAFSGFLSKVFGKNKGKGKAESLDQRPMVISGPVDLRKQREMQETKTETNMGRKPQFSGTSNNTDSTSGHVTSSRSGLQQQQQQQSPLLPGSRMTINNTVVLDELKQRVGHITLKRTGSKDSSGGGRESESPPKERVHGENSKQITGKSKVEPRVPYVPRSNSFNASDTSQSSKTKQTPVLVFQTDGKSFESNTDDDVFVPLNEPQNETQVASICMSPEMETSSPEAEEPEQVTVPVDDERVIQTDEMIVNPLPAENDCSSDAIDFQTKLAKFNRLSQKLSASFIAAAMNPPVNSNPIGRSNSYKAYKNRGKGAGEAIPPLPPKKKNSPCCGSTGAISIYDVPLNNKPVIRSESFKLTSRDTLPQNEENSIAAYIRGITKKNSTPDIVISGNNAKLFGLRDDDPREFRRTLNSNNSEDNFDVHKSSPSLPPPRPPKPKPPTKPKSLDFGLSRSKRNSESSSASSETVTTESQLITLSTLHHQPTHIPLQFQTLQLVAPVVASPATSNKSLLDIDTLDALSETGLSDTKASNSPPDSPKICPLHPDINERDNLSLSTIARSPDSLVTISDTIVPDSLVGTPDTEIFQSSITPLHDEPLLENVIDLETSEPISINKLEIVIHDNDGSPGLQLKSPDNGSRMDSLERNVVSASCVSVTPTRSTPVAEICQNIKFATVSTLIQEFETVQENEEEISELYDDFPAEFYTPTPSTFSGYSPSEVSASSTESSSTSSSLSLPSASKKHVKIDSIRNSGMEQLEAFLSFGSSTGSDDCSFESCTDNLPEDGDTKTSPSTIIPVNNNNVSKKGLVVTTGGVNRTGAISRLGHSSAIGHLQKILTNDVN